MIRMNPRVPQDIIPLNKLKVNPGKVVAHANETHRPVLITSRGRGVAVVLSLSVYEEETEQREFMRGVVKWLMDLDEGREISLIEAKKRFA